MSGGRPTLYRPENAEIAVLPAYLAPPTKPSPAATRLTALRLTSADPSNRRRFVSSSPHNKLSAVSLSPFWGPLQSLIGVSLAEIAEIPASRRPPMSELDASMPGGPEPVPIGLTPAEIAEIPASRRPL
jgi:hypothetical protein